MPSLPAWLLPVLGSAFALGFYDLCKKHAVNKNSVMHVLFYATLCGSAFYLLATVLWTGSLADANCSGRDFALIVLKSLLVASSWTCVYYAMRDLPISIAAPIRASSPVWTFLGGLLLKCLATQLFRCDDVLEKIVFGKRFGSGSLGSRSGSRRDCWRRSGFRRRRWRWLGSRLLLRRLLGRSRSGSLRSWGRRRGRHFHLWLGGLRLGRFFRRRLWCRGGSRGLGGRLLVRTQFLQEIVKVVLGKDNHG